VAADRGAAPNVVTYNVSRGEGAWTPLLAVTAVATGVLTGAVTTTLKFADGGHPPAETVLSGLSGLSFLAAGLVAHLRRPANRTGLLMMLVGVAFFAEDLQFSSDSVVFTIGLLLAHASSAPIAHLVLAFPDGRLPNRAARILTISAYLAVVVLPPLEVSFLEWDKATNLLLVVPAPEIGLAVRQVLDIVGMVIAAGVVVVLARRFLRANLDLRAALAPVLVIGIIGGTASAVGGALGGTHPLYPVLSVCYRVAFLLWPLAFLVGALWSRPRTAVIADLLIAARRPDDLEGLRDTLASALRDPSLRLGRWDQDTNRFLDADGRPVSAGTLLDNHDGRPVGALSRREVPWEDARTAEAVAALAGLVLDNQRLAEEASARLAEVHASRARLVTAAVDERRRVERDLHDGAQQRLVVVALGIQLAREQAGSDPELASLLDDASAGISAAISELRELARGIFPPLLTEAGLAAAVRELAERTPLPVEVVADDLPRLPAAVESTAYFVAAEALTNVLKHAAARRVRVRLVLRGARLRVEVADDGVGRGELVEGSGLSGLRDRVRALDGELTVYGSPGTGTTVVADIPKG
jgi:signal transduction histidine kinase